MWLWRRLAATALIRPLAWKPPYARGAGLEEAKRQKEKKKKKADISFLLGMSPACHVKMVKYCLTGVVCVRLSALLYNASWQACTVARFSHRSPHFTWPQMSPGGGGLALMSVWTRPCWVPGGGPAGPGVLAEREGGRIEPGQDCQRVKQWGLAFS